MKATDKKSKSKSKSKSKNVVQTDTQNVEQNELDSLFSTSETLRVEQQTKKVRNTQKAVVHMTALDSKMLRSNVLTQTAMIDLAVCEAVRYASQKKLTEVSVQFIVKLTDVMQFDVSRHNMSAVSRVRKHITDNARKANSVFSHMTVTTDIVTFDSVVIDAVKANHDCLCF